MLVVAEEHYPEMGSLLHICWQGWLEGKACWNYLEMAGATADGKLETMMAS